MLLFMIDHKQFANGRLVGMLGRKKQTELWDSLATLLNADSSGPEKSAALWQETWNNWKCTTRKKAMAINNHQRGTGGRPKGNSTLTLLEEKLLQFLSPVAVGGNKEVRAGGFKEDDFQLAVTDGGTCIKEEQDEAKNVCFIFSLNEADKAGTLANALGIFQKHKVNLLHIESRSSSRVHDQYEFMVECGPGSDLGPVIETLREHSEYLQIISHNHKDNRGTLPWFPLHIRDLDKFANNVFRYGGELDCDHPGFTDLDYRARRRYFADIAYNYKHGEPLPRVDYTEEEIATWGVVFRELTRLYPAHACKEHNHNFPLLVENCGFREDNIPQLEDVSNFLRDSTGFTLRPVAGLLSSRDFLAGLAFRVFHSTQYIRHPSRPLYTPEPDVCHELLGHVALFADPAFAQFSQEIGLASLGAPDDYVEKLATCFFFTVEYGLCRQDGELKAYGAGLLSSFGEMQHCIGGKAEFQPFEPSEVSLLKFVDTEYQPIYYFSESFEEAKQKMIKYAQTIPRPFGIRYNPYTQSIEVLDSKLQIESLVKNVHHEMQALISALRKL